MVLLSCIRHNELLNGSASYSCILAGEGTFGDIFIMYFDVDFVYTHVEHVFFAILKNCGIVKELIVVSEMLLGVGGSFSVFLHLLDLFFLTEHLLDYIILNVVGGAK